MMKFLKFMLFSAVVLVGYSMWKHKASNVKEIIGYDLVKAHSLHGNGELVARTRQVAEGDLHYLEVEIGPESWVYCQKDCSDILRRMTVDRDMVKDELR